MRRARIILAVALAAIVAIAAAAWLLFDANRFKSQIQARLEEQLGRKVEIGDIGFRLFPIRLTVENLRIAEDPRFKSEFPFTHIARLDVHVAFSGLLSGNLNVESVELAQATVELIRNENRIWNFSSLGRKDASGGAAASGAPSGFSLKRLTVAGASVAITDLLNKRPRTVYGPADISVMDYAVSQAGVLTANGKLELKSPKVGSVDIGYPLVMDYRISSDRDKGLLEILSATVQLGPMAVALTGAVNMNLSPIQVDLRLKAGETQVTEVSQLASSFGIVLARDTSVTGRLSGDVRAKGPIDRIALNGSISGRDIQMSGKTVPQSVRVSEVNATFTPDEIRSDEFEVSSGQTVAFGRFTVRSYFSKNAWMELALRAPGATLPEVQAIAKAYGLQGLDQLSGAGKVSFDLSASGPPESVASANIARTLNGTMNLDFSPLRIQGFDTLREIARIGGFLGTEQADKDYTEVVRVAGRIDVKNGIAETDDLRLNLPDLVLSTKGSSDLGSQTLALSAMAVFSKSFSDKVGANKIGGYLTTALSNEKGEIVIPVLINGDIRKPRFSADKKTFLELQKRRLLPGLLDRITEGKKTQTEPGKEEPKPGGLKGILRGIFK